MIFVAPPSFFFSFLSFLILSLFLLSYWEVRVGTSSAVGPSKRKRGNSPGMKMGRLKRHIPVYTTVIKGLASGLPLVPPKEGVPSSALVPASTSAISSSPVIDSVVPTACSSGKPASDRKRVLVANSPDIPAASPPAVSSCPDAPASGDTEIAGVVKLIPFGDSKRRKGALVFNQPDSSSMSSEDCVRLVHGFRLSSSSMPSFEDLAFSREYVEWASFEARLSFIFFSFFLLLILLLTSCCIFCSRK